MIQPQRAGKSLGSIEADMVCLEWQKNAYMVTFGALHRGACDRFRPLQNTAKYMFMGVFTPNSLWRCLRNDGFMGFGSHACHSQMVL